MTLRIINAEDVRRLLPMSHCIEVMAVAMQAASAGSVSIPPRITMSLPGQNGYLFVMPGAAAGAPVYGTKVISQYPSNPSRGLPAIQGFVALFDHDTGEPTTIIDGAGITAIRTAAASGLATHHLARHDARTHGVLGTGVQAAAHVEAIAAARSIDEVLIWGRNAAKAKRLAAELDVRACDDPEKVAACDIVSTVTGSVEPIIKGDWVKPGAHINLVGAHTPATREADSDLMAKGSIFVDLMESAMNESGNILIPIGERRIHQSHIKGEIGRVVSEEIAGRQSPEEITVYVSLGITAQDMYAAQAVYLSAVEADIGTGVRF